MLPDDPGRFEQHRAALDHGATAPAFEPRLRGVDGLVHLVGTTALHIGEDGAVRGVVDGESVTLTV